LEVSGLDRETNQGRETENLSRRNEGGAHFHVHGEPEKFNRLVKEFNADAVGLRSSLCPRDGAFRIGVADSTPEVEPSRRNGALTPQDAGQNV